MVGLLTLVVEEEVVEVEVAQSLIDLALAIAIEGIAVVRVRLVIASAVVATALHFVRMVWFVFTHCVVVCVIVSVAWVSLTPVEHAIISAGVTVIWHE